MLAAAATAFAGFSAAGVRTTTTTAPDPVDPKTHLAYVPLENVAGKPELRIMQPTDTTAR